ncbi:MAG TPA: beta-propeller fold lactonase family protein [Candidatus Sulfotelmatobacter sp.]|jgi:6-phosphogluconolactonase (cycloisomerase 2 family)
MKKFSRSQFCPLLIVLLSIVLLGILSSPVLGQAAAQYVITNDDLAFPFATGIGFFTVGSNGLPVFLQQIPTGSYGAGGGYFGMNRLAMLNDGTQQCVYASEARSGEILGININTLTIGGMATGSSGDGGTANGIGLVMDSNYLYASYSDSSTIGTFAVQQGCALTFLADIPVKGTRAGIINGMALHGMMLIASYTDGSIESFNVSGGTPISNGDKQASTATSTSQQATFANSIDITGDGHFAIFGDTATNLSVEVSDISSGKLSKTTVYQSSASISSSNLMLSPDETIIYVVNTQGDSVTALFFNQGTGAITPGCTSPRIKGQSQNWSYLGGAGLISQNGNGGGVYVAEFGTVPAIAMVTLTSAGGKCTLQEAPGSPVDDPNGPGLLSVGTFPPRSF